MPSVVPDRLLDSGRIGLENLLAGDVSGAIKGVAAPASLTPQERNRLAKQLGIAGSPYEGLFEAVTNPWLWASVILSMKFPVSSAKNMFRVKDQLAGYMRPLNNTLSKIRSIHSNFSGTHVPDDYTAIARDVMDFKSKFGGKLGTILDEFEKTTGSLPSRKQQIMMSMWLDGLHDASTAGAFRSKKGRDFLKIDGKQYKEIRQFAPDLEQHMGPALLKLARETDTVLKEVWDDVYGSLDNQKKIMRALSRMEKSGIDDDRVQEMLSTLQMGKRIEKYFPRRRLLTSDDFNEMLKSITSVSPQTAGQRAIEKAISKVGPEGRKRMYSMAPSLDDLAEVEDVLAPGVLQQAKEIQKARILHSLRGAAKAKAFGRDTIRQMESMSLDEILSFNRSTLGATEAETFSRVMAVKNRQYSLKAMPVLSNYLHTQAATWGWTVRDGGEKMWRHVDELRRVSENSAGAKQRLDMLQNTYIPIALGRGTFKTALRAQAWNESMLRLADSLDTPTIRNVLGADLHKWMTTNLAQSRGAFSLLNLNRKVSSYFYLSTLGGNVGSALNNMLQLVLTTGPTLGFRTTAQGASEAMRKAHKYFSLRFGSHALSHDEALRAAYKEFSEAGLAGSPMTDEAFQGALQEAFGVASLKGPVKTGERISRALMKVFSSSEVAVRLTTFEAGMIHATKGGLKGAEAIDFARKATEATQFLTGPANKPFALLEANPLVGQLMNFPLKLLEFATGTATRLGVAEKAGIGIPGTKIVVGKNYNLGTLARAVSATIIGKELGDYVGLDISDALLSGALPHAQGTERPFGIIPLVPPFYQLLGDAALSVVKGDSKYIRRDIPLLLPGGVQLTRIAGMSGTQVGQSFNAFIGRNYVDPQNPTPDGRLPLYTGDGQLKGYFTPLQITLMGMGLRPSDLSNEEQLVRTLVAQREDIVGQKRAYLEARFKNQATDAANIAGSFRRQYGFELPIREQDWNYYVTKRRITRVEQVLATMPVGPARDEMVQLVMTSLGAESRNLLGVEPTLLMGQPSTQAKTQSRARTSGPTPGQGAYKPEWSPNPFAGTGISTFP